MKEIILNANELPYNFENKEYLEEIISNFQFNRYPDAQYKAIRKKLGALQNVAPEQVIVTNGSDELIQLIMMAYTNEQELIVAMEPTFSEYKLLGENLQRQYLGIGPLEGLQLNKNKLLDCIESKDPELIFLCSPNNPTGELLDQTFVETVLNATQQLVVLDEAYIEFNGNSLKDLIDQYDHLIVLRTLSKAYGLASLRVGYGLANEKIINRINNYRMPYNVSGISVYLANHLLEKINLEDNISLILKEKERIIKILEQLGITYKKTVANFILLASEYNTAIARLAKQRNIAIREFDSVVLKDYIRFAIGTPEENDALISIFQEVIDDENR
jgi:histidinol-phosphate aminotransferase